MLSSWVARSRLPGNPATQQLSNPALVAVAVLFLIVRIVLLVVREPFFDELFTVWMARRPLGEIVPALLSDSGPPLYYFLARLTDVFMLRGLSLLFATGSLLLILSRKSLGDARYVAAALLAFYPPAALFAVDARAYALCGLFVAAGAIAIREERPFLAAAAMLLAAYTHWYGALFLPLILLAKPRLRAVIAFAAACVLFVPGLLLASRQPVQAMGWLGDSNPAEALNVFAFVGRYAEALFAPAPLFLVVLSAIVTVVALARNWTMAPLVLVPVLLAIAFALAGRTVYFPMRFESVLAVPLVLWLAASLERWPPRVRLALTTILCACGAVAIAIGVIDHYYRQADDYRRAARVLRGDEPVVATGYLYLETIHRLGEERVRAYPAEQASHPGWRAVNGEPFPQGRFLWIVERGAPELARLDRRAAVVYANDRAVILRVEVGP